MGESFRNLAVWQRAVEMTLEIYKLTSAFPDSERFGLTNQLRRASVSVASNIAEGQGRLSTGEFRQFLGIARGSNCELQTQLEIARALGMGDLEQIDGAEGLSREVGKMINAILVKIKDRQAGAANH